MKPIKYQEEDIIKAAIVYTEQYRPVIKDDNGDWLTPWTWLNIISTEEQEKLRSLCLAIQKYLYNKERKLIN